MRLTRQQAINAMCRGCIYDKHEAGTWRQQVEACTAPKCPLYPYRPVSKPETPKQREARLHRAQQRRSDDEGGES